MPVVKLNEKKRKLRNSTEGEEEMLASRFSGATACGIQSYQNRIQGGDISELDEFPWLALLFNALKQDPTKHEPVCGGVLVSPKFVITAAHCLVGEVTQIKGEL
jgi:secreted trypsin-like serine protease